MKAIDNLGNEIESNTATVTIPLPVPIPVPEGYVASEVEGENTIEGGYVIYEGTEPVTEANHATALTTRNQYVWIPVKDINDMIMCESNSGSSVCNLVLDGETLKCTTHPSTATNLVGRLYSGSTVLVEETSHVVPKKIYSYKIDFYDSSQRYGNNQPGWEPGTISGDTGFDLQLRQGELIAMATSVAKNKGFYISRYEAGKNGESKKGQLVLSATVTEWPSYVSSAGGWEGLHEEVKQLDKNKQMIWGCQYDQVVKFIGEDAQIADDYRVSLSGPLTSGTTELDKMKNIYNLEGNFAEWTLRILSGVLL